MFGFLVMVLIVALALALVLRVVQRPDGLSRGPSGAGLWAQQLDRVEAALSSLESRVNALEEQQRFMERLLESRPDGPTLAPGDEDVDSVLFERGEDAVQDTDGRSGGAEEER